MNFNVVVAGGRFDFSIELEETYQLYQDEKK